MPEKPVDGENHTLSIELTLYMQSYCTSNMFSSYTTSHHSSRFTQGNTSSKLRDGENRPSKLQSVEMLENTAALPSITRLHVFSLSTEYSALLDPTFKCGCELSTFRP